MSPWRKLRQWRTNNWRERFTSCHTVKNINNTVQLNAGIDTAVQTNAVNLGGWQFVHAIGYTIPANTVLPPGGYLVVARNASRMHARAAYSSVVATRSTVPSHA